MAGLVSGVLMLLAFLAARLLLATPSLLEVAAEWATAVVPPRLFARMLETLLTAGKPVLYLGETVVLLLVAAGGGLLYARAAARWPAVLEHPWHGGGTVALAVFALIVLGMAPLFGVGLLGAQAQGGALPFLAAAAGGALVYGLALAHLVARGRATTDGAGTALDPARRTFLRTAALWGGGLALVGGAGRLVLEVLERATPSRVPGRAGAMPPAVTPNDQFYVVSKNILDPEVSPALWNLTVAGRVRQLVTLTLEDLQRLPSVEEYVTLECISNVVGGDLMSNALWQGVPLRQLLDMAGVAPETRRLVFHAADGYTDTLPLEEAQREAVLVAYGMNGQPLPREHGAPARLLVPGRFGLKSVKWLTRIEATEDAEVRGFWQERGWSDDARVPTTSIFSVPAHGATVEAGAVVLGGVAYAGDRGVRRVEVSSDGGQRWVPAVLEAPLSRFTWVLWTAEWQPERTGRTELLVRATDGTGAVQETRVQDTFPDGATGLHRVRVTVV